MINPEKEPDEGMSRRDLLRGGAALIASLAAAFPASLAKSAIPPEKKYAPDDVLRPPNPLEPFRQSEHERVSGFFEWIRKAQGDAGRFVAQFASFEQDMSDNAKSVLQAFLTRIGALVRENIDQMESGLEWLARTDLSQLLPKEIGNLGTGMNNIFTNLSEKDKNLITDYLKAVGEAARKYLEVHDLARERR